MDIPINIYLHNISNFYVTAQPYWNKWFRVKYRRHLNVIPCWPKAVASIESHSQPSATRIEVQWPVKIMIQRLRRNF